MASLSLGYSLLVDSPARIFGFQKTPPYVHVEDISLLAAYRDGERMVSKTGVTMAGFRAIPEAGILIWEPRQKKVDTRLADYEFPTMAAPASDWTEASDSTSGKIALYMTNAAVNRSFDVRTKNLLPANSAFYIRLGRGQAAPTASVSPDSFYTVIVVGDDVAPSASGGASPYRLVLQDGYPPYLQQGVPDVNDPTTWYWGPVGENGVAGTNVTNCSTLFDEQNRMLEIEWLPLPDQNTLMVKLANGKETLVYRPKNTAVDQSKGVSYVPAANMSVAQGKLRFYGQNGTAHFQYLPMEFLPAASLFGVEITLPFVYQGNGSVTLPGATYPPEFDSGFTYTISQTDYTGTRIKYTLSVTGSGDPTVPVPYTPIITAIQMQIPPVFDYTATIGRLVDVSSKIGRISERQWYDREGGIVRTQCGLMLDNAYGDFSGSDGTHRAVQYSRWLTAADRFGIMQPLSAPVTFLTGWGGMDSSIWKGDPRREFDIVLEDRWYPLSIQDCGALPFLDGWAIKAAIRFLLNMSGVSDTDIADQFKIDPLGPNPPGSDDFKLKAATYSDPSVAYSPMDKFIRALEELSGFVHGVLFWNALGQFNGFNYNPGIFSTPYKGTFSATESGDPNANDFLTSMWGVLQFHINTADRRTGVFFAGKDPATNSVQGTFRSADDVWPGFTANVHGFRQNLTAVSSLFSDPEFTDRAAEAALEKVMLPNLFSRSQSAFLPNLYAMDRYGVYLNTGDIVGGVELVCEEIESEFDATNPSAFGSAVTGRWISNY